MLQCRGACQVPTTRAWRHERTGPAADHRYEVHACRCLRTQFQLNARIGNPWRTGLSRTAARSAIAAPLNSRLDQIRMGIRTLSEDTLVPVARIAVTLTDNLDHEVPIGRARCLTAESRDPGPQTGAWRGHQIACGP